MQQTKTHVTPVFRVIKQNEANAKFFVASGAPQFTNTATSVPNPAAATLTVGQTTGWF